MPFLACRPLACTNINLIFYLVESTARRGLYSKEPEAPLWLFTVTGRYWGCMHFGTVKGRAGLPATFIRKLH